MLLAPTIALLLCLGTATDLEEMCSLSTQFERFTCLSIIQGLCALLHRCPGSRGHVWTRQVICQVLSAITRLAHYFTANCSLGPAAFSNASINCPSVRRHVVQPAMQMQERTLNTAAWFVNAVASVKMRARTRQARLVLVQLAK